MAYANNLDPDEAPQNVGLHLRSKLFDIQIIYQQNIWEETMFFCIFWKKKILKKNTQHTKSWFICTQVPHLLLYLVYRNITPNPTPFLLVKGNNFLIFHTFIQCQDGVIILKGNCYYNSTDENTTDVLDSKMT